MLFYFALSLNPFLCKTLNYVLQENSEEMYSLDNDSFLNSLEAMTIQNYWTDNVKHTKLWCDWVTLSNSYNISQNWLMGKIIM